ncbi:amidase [Nocardia sp. NPDC051463]|uniref:amidase n=1 Tax=Nocardia sp. NPDC051463 TaxID=3154845 RepID=UPI003432536D
MQICIFLGVEICGANAKQIAAAVSAGVVSAVEVMTAHLARIETVDPVVNAVTNVLADSALTAAEQVDRRLAAGAWVGPLAGVPFTVKENIHVAGSATTMGVPRLRHLVASEDAPPVRRLRAAGAIPIGRTNLPDLTIAGMHTTSTLYGDTRNPWDPAGRSPGGSSGGDGVAVATGMTPLGLGNDSGGSLRIPAMFNGVAALKPSYGRFAADHRIGGQEPTLASQVLPVDGPMARSVADLRLVYEVLAGADPQDPRAVPVPVDGAALAGPVRIGLVVDPGGHGVHPHVRAAVQTAAAVLRKAGYLVEEVETPALAEALEVYAGLISTEFSLVWSNIRPLLSVTGRRHLELIMQRRPPLDLAGYVQLTAARLGVQRQWASFFTRYSLLLGPVSTELPPAPLVPADAQEHERMMEPVRLCAASSLVGVPAVAVPVGVTDGLPQGVQLIGGMYREDLCLTAAAVIENELGVVTPVDPIGTRR